MAGDAAGERGARQALRKFRVTAKIDRRHFSNGPNRLSISKNSPTKTSPKVILSLLALSLCAAAPLARAVGQATTEVAPQTPAAPDKAKHPMGGKRLKKAVAEHDKMLTEKLKLTAEQQEKLAAIRKDQAEQIKSGAKPGDVAKTGHDQVRALLTPEQQKDFDAMPPEGRARKKAKKGEQP